MAIACLYKLKLSWSVYSILICNTPNFSRYEPQPTTHGRQQYFNNFAKTGLGPKAQIFLRHEEAGHGMEWNGKWNGMERKFRYGIWKMPEWNGMEDFKNGMEDNLPYFHTNSILDFVHCICRKIHTDVW